MKEYRIYELHDGKHVSRPPRILEALDDDVVIEKAKQLLDGIVLEVWERDRIVVRLEPKKDLPSK